MDLDHSLSELGRLGLHLDPADASAAAERRRVRLNTHTYPIMRALGYQLLIAAVVVHNAVLFDAVGWRGVLLFGLLAELYTATSWLALRRWFKTYRGVRGWDLSDLLFLGDLLLWAAAIRVTGGPLSLLWIVPLLRVADHNAVARVWTFVHAAPLSYALAVFWPPRPPTAAGLEGDLLKIGFLYVAGLYIAYTGIPARRFRQQRAATLSAGAALLARLTERTERLHEARQSRSVLIDELGTGIRTSLIEIVGFSGFLLRSDPFESRSARSYVERIHRESHAILRGLDQLAESGPAPLWPRISLSGVLQSAAAEEAAENEQWRESATLSLPAGNIEIRADATRLRALVRHVIAACRYFQEGPPAIRLKVEPGTGLPEAILVTCAAGVPAGGPRDELFDPWSATGNQQEMAARLELSIARSMSRSLGYDVELAPDRLTVVVKLR